MPSRPGYVSDEDKWNFHSDNESYYDSDLEDDDYNSNRGGENWRRNGLFYLPEQARRAEESDQSVDSTATSPISEPDQNDDTHQGEEHIGLASLGIF